MSPCDANAAPPAAAPPLRVLHSPQLSLEQLREALAAHDAAIASGQGRLKDDVRTAATRVPCGGAWAAVKEYRRAGPVDWVKELLRGSRVRRAWRGAEHLARKGVSAPELLAVLRRGPTAYLITRFVDGAGRLDELLAGRFSGILAAAELRAKRSLLHQLAAWLRSIHDLGIYHDDWSAKNFLAAESGGGWVFYLLDFESLSARKRLTHRRRVKNLAQLMDLPPGVTLTDKMRILVAYARGEVALTRGCFPRDIERQARRRIAEREARWARALARRAREKR